MSGPAGREASWQHAGDFRGARRLRRCLRKPGKANNFQCSSVTTPSSFSPKLAKTCVYFHPTQRGLLWGPGRRPPSLMGCAGSKPGSEDKAAPAVQEEEGLSELTGVKQKAERTSRPEKAPAAAPLARPLLTKQPSNRTVPDGAISSSTDKFVAKRATIGSNRNLTAANADSADQLSGVRLSTASAGGFDDPRSHDYSKESPENDRKSRMRPKKEKPWDA